MALSLETYETRLKSSQQDAKVVLSIQIDKVELMK